MSDFLLSSRPVEPGWLASGLGPIHADNATEAAEHHGPWGSLAVTGSRYNGFQPLLTERHICVVVGGPVLHFRDNGFLTGDDAQAGTRAILERWAAGAMDWGSDLSGPFVVLVIDKASGEAVCVTDLLLLLPVYRYDDGRGTVLGTHVDAVARAAGQPGRFDEAALVDFVLQFTVTFPYTAYEAVRQLEPATVHSLAPAADGREAGSRSAAPYWRPVEETGFADLPSAARALRDAVVDEVERITSSLDRVAQFISAGEDSRALAGMLPRGLRRDAFVFVDGMNREGRIARRAAAAYGATFNVEFRRRLHYLTILPAASALVGAGHQFIHAHTLGFDRTAELARYAAVLGGYAADSFYKAYYANKPPICFRHGFVPERILPGETRTVEVRNPLFPAEVLAEVTRRRRAHMAVLQSLRPRSAHEWFVLWPMTMRATAPNLYCNRRLFASYEPFLASAALKVGAAVPAEWKINRRLFNRAFRRYLLRAPALPHADGRLPYLPWWANLPIQLGTVIGRRLMRRFGRREANPGPWNDWPADSKTVEWRDLVRDAMDAAGAVPALRAAVERGAFDGGDLNVYQKVNLLQACLQAAHGRRGEAVPS